MTRIVSIETPAGTRYAIEYSFLRIFKRYKCNSLNGVWWPREYMHHALYQDLKTCMAAYKKYKYSPTPVPISELEKVIYDP